MFPVRRYREHLLAEMRLVCPQSEHALIAVYLTIGLCVYVSRDSVTPTYTDAFLASQYVLHLLWSWWTGVLAPVIDTI